MSQSTNIRKTRHCVFNLHVHLVFVTKYRKEVFTQSILRNMRAIFAKICFDLKARLVEFEGEYDHVHLLIEYPPTVGLSKLVNLLKGSSSRKLKQSNPEILKHYWKGALWSPSYFAGSCGGAPIDIIRKYIENQSTPLQ